MTDEPNAPGERDERTGLFKLTTEECVDALTATTLGRIVFMDGDQPLALPVNFAWHEGSIVFRTGEGQKMYAATLGQRVAFEIDDIDPVDAHRPERAGQGTSHRGHRLGRAGAARTTRRSPVATPTVAPRMGTHRSLRHHGSKAGREVSESTTVADTITVDGNEAAAKVAYDLSDVVAIYPITPASPMGELCDVWAAAGRTNSFGAVPEVIEMQSEGGAAGAVHGALQAGAMTTTFTASQGLLLMIPNIYKLVGELTPTVIHIAARALATHALSIFGDHSDVMAARQTGAAMLSSSSVQEAQDLALVAHAATLRTRVPFLHFFDGFRTSHEVAKIDALPPEAREILIDDELIADHRLRGLDPNRPVLRGTAQNPDVFFQAREAANLFHAAVPAAVQTAMDQLAETTGRSYHLFDYDGAADAEDILVIMGSGVGAVQDWLPSALAAGRKVGVVTVRLFRPFSVEHLIAALPSSTKRIAVLDRTKEPGSVGEPLYTDICSALMEQWTGPMPLVIGGRYGLGSKEFTPAMVAGVFTELAEHSTPPPLHRRHQRRRHPHQHHLRGCGVERPSRLPGRVLRARQ